MRIIAGGFRGHPLVAPRGQATRPTSDRVREALFSILGDIQGVQVLDLYAGSGALGLEALSRGAASATFVESARAAAVAIRRNIEALEVQDRAALLARDVRPSLRGLAKQAERYGLVFLDPPYAQAETAEILADLVESGAMADGAWIVLEHAARSAPPAPPGGLRLRFTRTYGDTALTVYRYEAKEAE